MLPVGLDQVKLHLIIDHNADDALLEGEGGLGGLIIAAANEVERRGSVAFIKQKRRLVIDDEPVGGVTVALPNGPIIGLLDVKYIDSDGNEQTMPASAYRFSAKAGSIYFNSTVPYRAAGPGTLWIDYECGFGTSPTSVPTEWQVCIATLAMRKFERREGVAGQADDAWERAFDRMVVAAGANRRY